MKNFLVALLAFVLAALAPAAPAQIVNPQFIQQGVDAKARSFLDKARESVSVKDFGAVGDGVTDDHQAFVKAIASFPTTLDNASYSMAGVVLVPFGKYRLSQSLVIERNIHLLGVGSPAGNSTGGSHLIFDDNQNGIVVNSTRVAVSGKGGDGTTIEGLHITQANTGGTLGHGIWLRARARIIRCMVNGFNENGIHIVPGARGNANSWSIDESVTNGNGGHGLFVDGGDTNAGHAHKLDARQNGGWGIYDSSFLGNTYTACSTDSNKGGAYKTDDGNARNVFLGCYSESGQPASSLIFPTLVLGGIHGAGFTSGSTHSQWVDGVLRPGRNMALEQVTLAGVDQLLQRDGVTPQASAVANTYTSTTNFEAVRLRWSANFAVLETIKGSAGGTGRSLIVAPLANLFLRANSANGWTIDNNLRPEITNTLDLGTNATRPKDLWLAGKITTGAPSGGTAAAWKLGTVSSTSPTSPNRTIQVEIGGTTYYLHAKTTND